MLSLRSSFAASVACLLLLGGPAQAARTRPAASKTARPQTHRSAPRPAAQALASRPASQPAPPATPGPAPEASAPVEARQVCLAGTVLGADGQPRPGVCVFSTANVRRIAVTNAHGAFQLQVPAHTALSLQAEYVGLGSTRVAIDGETAQPVHITLGH